MAFYTPTISNPNTIGGLTSEVIVINTASDFNSFILKANTENLVLTSINILSLNNDISQISQPITFTQKDATGNSETIVQVPFVDSYSFQAQIKDLAILSMFKFDGLSKIDYPILAGSNIKMSLTVANKDAVSEQIKKAFQYSGSNSWEDQVKAEMGLFREPEEIKVEKPFSPIIAVEQKETLETQPKTEVLAPIKVVSSELREPNEIAKVEPKPIEKPIASELKEPGEVPVLTKPKDEPKKEAKTEGEKEVPKTQFKPNYTIIATISLLAIYISYKSSKES